MRACMPQTKRNTISLRTLSDRPRPLRLKSGLSLVTQSDACQHFVSIAVLTRCIRLTTRCNRCGSQVSVTGLLFYGSEHCVLWSTLSCYVRRCGRPSTHRIVCEVRP